MNDPEKPGPSRREVIGAGTAVVLGANEAQAAVPPNADPNLAQAEAERLEAARRNTERLNAFVTEVKRGFIERLSSGGEFSPLVSELVLDALQENVELRILQGFSGDIVQLFAYDEIGRFLEETLLPLLSRRGLLSEGDEKRAAQGHALERALEWLDSEARKFIEKNKK